MVSRGMSERPNILFILTDQQSSTMLSCAGNEYLSTPAMDSLAAEGVRFGRAYCTNPVSIASRFSLMTGLMPSAIGMLSNRTADLHSIPQSIKNHGLGCLLRQAGYEPAYAGKVHLPKMSIADVGFEHLCEDARDQLARTCADFIIRKKDQPFALVASFINPHDICYMAIRDAMRTEEEKRLIQHGRVECAALDAALARPPGVDDQAFFARHCPPLPPNFEPQTDEPEAIRILLEHRPFRMSARRKWTPQRWREHRWAYARLTERVDGQIAQVLSALRESGQADRTLIVFTSDHGDMDSSHRLEHKSTLYDEACRVPLIIRPPGGAKTGRVDHAHLVSNGLDLLPTLCDWAGLSSPPEMQGRSLRPLVEDASSDAWRQHVPIECAVGRAVVTGTFKYARYDIGANQEQLTDLACDPREQRNALNDPCHAKALEELRTLFQKSFGGQPRDPAAVLKAAPGA